MKFQFYQEGFALNELFDNLFLCARLFNKFFYCNVTFLPLTIHDSILYLNVEGNDEQIKFNSLIKKIQFNFKKWRGKQHLATQTKILLALWKILDFSYLLRMKGYTFWSLLLLHKRVEMVSGDGCWFFTWGKSPNLKVPVVILHLFVSRLEPRRPCDTREMPVLILAHC
jgi:hypothetical protein